jgi:hypothetical protein
MGGDAIRHVLCDYECSRCGLSAATFARVEAQPDETWPAVAKRYQRTRRAGCHRMGCRFRAYAVEEAK